MARSARAGRPLLTSPDEFWQELPLATRELNAALNLLLVKAELGYSQVVAAHGLDLDSKQTSRQMRKVKTGPSDVFYNAILASVAPKLGRTLEDLHAEFDPQLELARNKSATSRPVIARHDADNPPRPRSGRATTLSPELKRNTEWLAGLLIDNAEQRAVDEMDKVFTFADLVDALIDLTLKVDPGMPAALLDEVRRRDFPRSSRIFGEIAARNPEAAQRIAAVSSSPSDDDEPSVFEQAPMISRGRRLAGVIQKGRVARASREVLGWADDIVRSPESFLAAIIDTGESGSMLAGQLLGDLMNKNTDVMVLSAIQLIRYARRLQRRPLLAELYQVLRPEVRTEILVRLSRRERLPNVIGLESAEHADLIDFVGVQREYPEHLRTALLDTRLTQAGQYGVGHLIEAVNNLGPLLDTMLVADRDQTTRLLARALDDWDQRLRPWTGIPDMYLPLVALGDAVLQVPRAELLVSDLVTKYPGSGWLLFESLPWRDAPRFAAMVAALVGGYDVASLQLARRIAEEDLDPRLRRFRGKLENVVGEPARPLLFRFANVRHREDVEQAAAELRNVTEMRRRRRPTAWRRA